MNNIGIPGRVLYKVTDFHFTGTLSGISDYLPSEEIECAPRSCTLKEDYLKFPQNGP
jgi:hypothetical protein